MRYKNRILELDLLKTFIIIVSMIGIHTMYDLTLLHADDGAMEYVLNFLASPFGAPVFMFCMGMALCLSSHQTPTDYLRRGIQLITFGMVLNALRYLPTAYSAMVAGEDNIFSEWALIFNVDILQFAGLAFMLIALFRRLKVSRRGMLALGLVMNLVGTLLDGCYTDSYVVNQILGYFYPTPTCCCFPLMNWFVFVAAGKVMGWIYLNRDAGKYMRTIFPVSTVITVVYVYLCSVAEVPYLRVIQDDWGYYSMHTPDALFTTFGIAPFMLGAFRLLTRVVPQGWEKGLTHPSRHINQYYCVSWVWIMWTANLLLFVPKATTEAGFLFVWMVIIALTAMTVVFYNRYLKTSMDAFFGRHSTAWIIGIWISLLMFGTWYFTTVPGPYTTPY